ncbi:pantoate--beta-alanine ligase [Shivajiella indica]|uniref:Pantothenate synthetase n=1 Tax=Shivajiella indica TaxID=872115 RepID=A0ABW5B1R8_9BACT
MIILHSKEAFKSFRQNLAKDQITVGFVPTMGALHNGHLELVKKAKDSTRVVIVSIFVNPTQFNNPSDFSNYPKTLEKDLELLRAMAVDCVFVPDNQEIYTHQPKLKMDFGDLERVLEGSFRPGHFNGVGIVVSKLLNIVKPHKAFFGQKDLQQVAVIKRLVEDLSFDVEIEVVPTVREEDGLALSSRNLRLGKEDRIKSLILYKALTFSKTELLAGRDWLEVRNVVEKMFAAQQGVELEYYELVHTSEMKILDCLVPGVPVSICTAAYVGEVRLIDNISVLD